MITTSSLTLHWKPAFKYTTGKMLMASTLGSKYFRSRHASCLDGIADFHVTLSTLDCLMVWSHMKPCDAPIPFKPRWYLLVSVAVEHDLSFNPPASCLPKHHTARQQAQMGKKDLAGTSVIKLRVHTLLNLCLSNASMARPAARAASVSAIVSTTPAAQ